MYLEQLEEQREQRIMKIITFVYLNEAGIKWRKRLTLNVGGSESRMPYPLKIV